MAYTNSPLVDYTNLSPNHSGLRTHSIDRITPALCGGAVVCGKYLWLLHQYLPAGKL